MHYEIGKPFHLLFTCLCCLFCFILFHDPGQRPAVIEFSPLSLPMGRKGELKAAKNPGGRASDTLLCDILALVLHYNQSLVFLGRNEEKQTVL